MTGDRPDPVAGAWNLDGDLIASVKADGRPRAAVYPHPGTAAVVGHGGDPWIETRPDVLARDGVPLLRRRGGGCAVVVDPGNLICSAVLPIPGLGGITRAFAAMTTAVAAGAAGLNHHSSRKSAPLAANEPGTRVAGPNRRPAPGKPAPSPTCWPPIRKPMSRWPTPC